MVIRTLPSLQLGVGLLFHASCRRCVGAAGLPFCAKEGIGVCAATIRRTKMLPHSGSSRGRMPLGHLVDAAMRQWRGLPCMEPCAVPSTTKSHWVEARDGAKVGSNDVGDKDASSGGRKEHLYHPGGTIPRYGKAAAPVRTHAMMAPPISWWSMC
jgi:hypothetical protein